MSESFNQFDSQFTDEQLNTALKMIITAFENQNRASSNEINRLEEKLAKSNMKIIEMEQKYAAIVQNRSQYDTKMASIIDKNNQLNQRLQELINENTKLKNIKKSIISTIERTDLVEQSDQLSPFESSQTTATHKKSRPKKQHKNPQLYYEENKKATAFDNNKSIKDKEYSIDSRMKKRSTLHKSFNTINLLQQHPKLSRNLSNYTPSSAVSDGRNGIVCSSPKVNSFNMSSDFIDSIFLYNSGCNSNSKGGGNYSGNGSNKNFFKNCRKEIDQGEYKEMIEIIRGFNMKKISKQDTFTKISSILQLKYPELYEEFKKMFRPHD